MSSPSDLPPAMSSMWRAVKRGYEAEPSLLIVAFGLSLRAAQSGLRSRPYVLVAVHDLRLDSAARRDHRAARVDSPGAGAARRVRLAYGAHLHLAAGRRARRGRARRIS